jgi:hypothetical protein
VKADTRQVRFVLDSHRVAKLKTRAEADALSVSALVRMIVHQFLDGRLMTRAEHQRLLNLELMKLEKSKDTSEKDDDSGWLSFVD